LLAQSLPRDPAVGTSRHPYVPVPGCRESLRSVGDSDLRNICGLDNSADCLFHFLFPHDALRAGNVQRHDGMDCLKLLFSEVHAFEVSQGLLLHYPPLGFLCKFLVGCPFGNRSRS